MLKHKARKAITTGLALGMLATITMAAPAIAETTDAAATVTVSNTNNGDILTPDANGDFTYTNDSGMTTTVHVVVSGNGSKDENTGNYTVPALTYDKSNDDITFKANFNPNQGGMAMTGYTKLDNAAGHYETNSWEDDYSDSLPYTIDENGVTHINIHDAFNISTQDIDGNEDVYGGVAATWMKSWAAYDNFRLQVNKGDGEFASNDPAMMFTPTAEDMGNGFTIPKTSLPTKEGYHIKAFRTDKYNQDVPVNFTADGNAVLSLAELTHTRIMADGATRYSRADTWFNSITPIFEADETTPNPDANVVTRYIIDGNGGTTATGETTIDVTADQNDHNGVWPPDIEELFKRDGYRIVGVSVHAQDDKADTPAPEMPYPVADGTKTTTIDNTGKKIITFTKYIQWAKNDDITFIDGASKQFTNVPTDAGEIKAPTNFVDKNGNPVIGFTSIRTGESVKPGQRIPDTKKGNTFYAVFNGGELTDLIPEPDPVTPPTPGTDDNTQTDGVPPTIEPVVGKNTVMFYSGKLNKGETSVTNTGEHADIVAPNSEYSLTDGTMVKRWVSTDDNIVLMPGGHYDADSIKDKVFVADYVTPSPHDYDPNQEYPQNVSHIQLIFHGNGGTDEHGAIQYATSGDPSATDLPVRPTYTREGYTFKGWSRNGYGTEVNVITANNMINLKSIGKRSVMADPNDPHKVIVVYNVYAIWEKNETTPDTPVTPPTPDTPDTPGETPGTVTPDNPVTPGNQNSTSSTNETPSQSTDTEKTSKKKTDNPETGDAASSAGIIAGIGVIFTSLGIMRKRRNQ